MEQKEFDTRMMLSDTLLNQVSPLRQESLNITKNLATDIETYLKIVSERDSKFKEYLNYAFATLLLQDRKTIFRPTDRRTESLGLCPWLVGLSTHFACSDRQFLLHRPSMTKFCLATLGRTAILRDLDRNEHLPAMGT